jgi:hypothetical protein
LIGDSDVMGRLGKRKKKSQYGLFSDRRQELGEAQGNVVDTTTAASRQCIEETA